MNLDFHYYGDRATMFSWEFDSEPAKEFKLLCQPNRMEPCLSLLTIAF